MDKFVVKIRMAISLNFAIIYIITFQPDYIGGV